MIPKRLIYAWFGDRPLPKDFLRYRKGWLTKNPGYELLEINEHNFDIDQFTFSREAYQAGQMAFVADVARIWAVHQFGGIYLDTDVEVLKSLDELRRDPQFWGMEDAGQVNSGLAFGAKKGDPTLAKILAVYRQKHFAGAPLTSVTTVKVVSEVLRQEGLRNNRRLTRLADGGVVFPPVYFAPLHYWGGGRIQKRTYAVHHYQPSPVWTEKQTSKGRYLAHQLMYYVPLIGRMIRWLKAKQQ